MNRKVLKEQAKESLTGKYGDSVAIILILSVISFFASFIIGKCCNLFHIYGNNQIFYKEIGSFLISSIFTFGYLSYFLKISRDEDVEINELWSKTNYFIPYIIVTILIAIFTTLWSLLLIIPGIIAIYSYSMTYYIMLDNPSLTPIQALKESKKIMQGHKFDFFKLQLSFIGWFLLGILSFGILYFILIPYMYVTFSKFYDSIKD